MHVFQNCYYSIIDTYCRQIHVNSSNRSVISKKHRESQIVLYSLTNGQYWALHYKCRTLRTKIYGWNILFQLLFVGGFYFSSSSLLHNSRLCLEQRVGECCCPSIFMNILHNWPPQTCLIIIPAMQKQQHCYTSSSLSLSCTWLLATLQEIPLIYYNGLL